VRTKSPRQSDKILEAAARLFGTQRFHEVRMDDIATAAEVGKGTLYRYFSDKEELYAALLARASEQFMAGMKEVVAGEGSPRARLEAVVAAIIAYFDALPHLMDLIMRAEVQKETGSAFPWQKAREDLLRLLIGLCEEGRECGEFDLADPELMLLMLLGGVRSVIRFGERPRRKDLARRITDHFLQGADLLGRRPQPRRKGLSPMTEANRVG
jgi:AcrR family transcriptional regulator